MHTPLARRRLYNVVMDATRLAATLLEGVPANRTFRIQVLRAVDSSAEVALALEPDIHNVIGSLHSSGLIALVDATGLAAIIAAAADEAQLEGVVPLGSAARLGFLAPARGRLRGRCALGREHDRALRAFFTGDQPRAHVETVVELLDADEAAVCRGTFTWKIRRLAGDVSSS
jgi:acyl-coenzyme A thioesterase PaaI-like protein